MIRKILSPSKSLIALLAILGMYSIIRICFYLFNIELFHTNNFNQDILPTFFYGLRFDISAITYTNALFIFFSFLPIPFKRTYWYQIFLSILFFVPNSIALFWSIIDIGYFPFVLKRSTMNVFSLSNEIHKLAVDFVIDYWYLVILYAVCLALTGCMYFKYIFSTEKKKTPFFIEGIIFLFAFILSAIALRGGLQLKPISPIIAGQYTVSQYTPLVTNTPFIMLYSLEHNNIKMPSYMSLEEARANINYCNNFSSEDSNIKDNIVIIVLESFGKEYIGGLNRYKGYTPFLDSLMDSSLVMTNAYADGKQSREGLVAIAGGIPALMDDPYISSVYQDNNINGLGTILKKQGYVTSFYHGADNGTMGFQGFIKTAGFDHYFGLNEYPVPTDYDGQWGIYDLPYFKYFAKELDKKQTPFCSMLFSLSSHHPFSIPKGFENKFPKGTLPIHEVIGYTDYALAQFFKQISIKPWFKNTLFIITADHASLSDQASYQSRAGNYAIPIIFYKYNSNLKGKIDFPVHQVDILPSIIDYLNIDIPYCSFGKSVFDTSANHITYNYINNVYSISDNQYILITNMEGYEALYDYRKDFAMKKNLIAQLPDEAVELKKLLQSYIQVHHNALIKNELYLTK